MFKFNGFDSILRTDGVAATNFNHIENLTFNDNVSAFDLNRPISNLASNDFDNYSFLEKLARQLYNKNGVFSNSLNSAFTLTESTDIRTLDFGNLAADPYVPNYKTFLRVSPGIAGVGFTQTRSQEGWLIVNKPEIEIAERQLSIALGLSPLDDMEYVKIKYNYSAKTYKMRVVKVNTTGLPITYDFINGEAFEEDTIGLGFSSFIEMVSLLYSDATKAPLYSNFIYRNTPEQLVNITCEPLFLLEATASVRYLKINNTGNFVLNTSAPAADEFGLWSFQAANLDVGIDSRIITNLTDRRIIYEDKVLYTQKIDFNTTAETDDYSWIYSSIEGSDTIMNLRIGTDVSDKIRLEYFNGTTAAPIAEFYGENLTSKFYGYTIFGDAYTDLVTINSTIVSDLVFNDANRYIKLGGSTGSVADRTLFVQNDGTGVAYLTVEGDITTTKGAIITGNTTSYLMDTVATTLNIGGAATTLNLGYDGTTASSTTNINTGALTTGTKTLNIGTAGTTGSTTAVNVGSIIGSGAINLHNYTINLGTSTANATTVKVGGAITGNIFKIAGTAAGVINITTDVTSGTVNLFDSLSTGTFNIANNITTGVVNIATGGASTTNIGGTNAIVVLGETSGMATLRTNSGVTTANVFDTNATTIHAFGAATTLNLGYDGTATGSTTNINVGALTAGTKTINIGTNGTTGSSTIIDIGSIVGTGAITLRNYTINLGTSTANATTTTIGGAITGNTLKLSSVAAGTINFTTDVTAGGIANFLTSLTTSTLNIATGITTGTVNIATAGASTTNIGGAAALVYIGTTSGTIDTKTAASTANVFNTNATTVNAFNAGTSVNLANSATTFNIATTPGANQTISIGATGANSFTQTLNIGTGLTTTAQTINIGTGLTTGVQTINLGTGASMSATQAINIGSSASSTGYVSVLNTTEATNAGVASIKTSGGLYVAKKAFIVGDFEVFSTTTKFKVATATGDATIAGDLAVNGGDLTSTVTTFNLLSTPTTVNFAPAATSLNIANTATGAQTINIGTAVDTTTAQTITIGKATNTASKVLIAPVTNSTSTTSGALVVNGGVGIGEDVYIGATLNVNGTTALTGNTTITGDLAVNGGDLTSTATTFNLLATPTTINIGAGATTAINIGASSGVTTFVSTVDVDATPSTASVIMNGGLWIKKQLYVTTAARFASTVNITGNTTITGDLAVNGGDLTSSSATFNLLTSSSNKVINVGDTGSTGYVTIQSTKAGSAYNAAALVVSGGVGVAGAVNTNSTMYVASTFTTDGTINANGGTIATNDGIFNLINTTATTVNFAGASTAMVIGASSAGTTTFRNTTDASSSTVGAIQIAGGLAVAKKAYIGSDFYISGNSYLTGDLAIYGGDITTNITTGTFNILNSGLTGTLNIAGATNAVNIGSAASITTLGNDLYVTGNQVRIASKYEFNYDSVTDTLDLIYVG